MDKRTYYDTITALFSASTALRKKDVEERGWNSGFSAKGPTIAEGEVRGPGNRWEDVASDARYYYFENHISQSPFIGQVNYFRAGGDPPATREGVQM
jgi:hypothetical protein